MLGIAFKEWAAVCRALAEGRQSLILRKGGIAESGGAFRPEHSRFWLYPTAFHEHRDGLKSNAMSLHDAALADRSPTDTVRLTHLAEVAAVHRIGEWPRIEALDALHIWSPATVRQKFEYRSPGLYVLVVRMVAVTPPIELSETPEYAGCKTWVDLARELPDDGTPVLTDDAFMQAIAEIESRLKA